MRARERAHVHSDQPSREVVTAGPKEELRQLERRHLTQHAPSRGERHLPADLRWIPAAQGERAAEARGPAGNRQRPEMAGRPHQRNGEKRQAEPERESVRVEQRVPRTPITGAAERAEHAKLAAGRQAGENIEPSAAMTGDRSVQADEREGRQSRRGQPRHVDEDDPTHTEFEQTADEGPRDECPPEHRDRDLTESFAVQRHRPIRRGAIRVRSGRGDDDAAGLQLVYDSLCLLAVPFGHSGEDLGGAPSCFQERHELVGQTGDSGTAEQDLSGSPLHHDLIWRNRNEVKLRTSW